VFFHVIKYDVPEKTYRFLNTLTGGKEYERQRNLCRLVNIEFGLRLQRVRDGYVKK
jgi:hypothetical protein